MIRTLLAAACGLLLLAATSASAVTIDWVTVGNPGNAGDPQIGGPFGAVATTYRIAKTEVTNAQYTEFLNAVAATDTNALYHTSMNSDARGGITRSGVSGSFTYAVKSGQGNNPVVFVNFYDSLRFANWLHNGQPTGVQDNSTTEDGAYTITPAGLAANSITRNGGATVFLTSENEWYKAAYHKNDGVTGNYWHYPTSTDTVPHSDNPSSLNTPDDSNVANYYRNDGIANGYNDGWAVTGVTGGFVNTTNYLTDVGAYSLADSPYGTFDQGGNVWEWNEAIIVGNRGVRGGSWFAGLLAASDRDLGIPFNAHADVGFRVASLFSEGPLVPEPGSIVLGLVALVGLLWSSRRVVIRRHE